MSVKPGTVIAVDFDGTCVTHEFPKIGRDIGAERVLMRLVEAGAKIILWTMRSDGRERLRDGTELKAGDQDLLWEATQWFKNRGIPLYGVQRNPTQNEWTKSPKAYANIYIDDAALGCPLCKGLPGERPFVDWEEVERILFGDKSDGEPTNG